MTEWSIDRGISYSVRKHYTYALLLSEISIETEISIEPDVIVDIARMSTSIKPNRAVS